MKYIKFLSAVQKIALIAAVMSGAANSYATDSSDPQQERCDKAIQSLNDSVEDCNWAISRFRTAKGVDIGDLYARRHREAVDTCELVKYAENNVRLACRVEHAP